MAMTRRNLLKSMGSSAALLLPLLRTARAQTAGAVGKSVFMYWANGIVPDAWTPRTYGMGFQHNYCTQPLIPHQANVILFDKTVTNNPSQGTHDTTHFLRAKAAESVDSYIARRKTTPVRQLCLSAESVRSSAAEKYITFNQNGNASTVYYNPADAYNYLFSGFSFPTTPPPPARPTLNSPSLAQRKSVLDTVLADFNSIKPFLSGAEVAKFNTHFDLIRTNEMSIAAQIAAGTTTPPPAPSMCRPLSVPSGAASMPFDRKMPLLIDLIVMGLLCGRTDVATLTMCESVSDTTYPFLTGRRTFLGSTNLNFAYSRHHGCSHYLTPDGCSGQITNQGFSSNQLLEFKAEIDRWHMEMLALLISRLKEFGLFSSTVVFMGNEITGGAEGHYQGHVPFILASGSSAFRTGQAINMSAGANASLNHSSILGAILTAMGMPMTYGGAGYVKPVMNSILS